MQIKIEEIDTLVVDAVSHAFKMFCFYYTMRLIPQLSNDYLNLL